MDPIKLSHMAGYFDGKGSVGIYYHNRSKTYTLRTSIMKKKDAESEIFFRRVKDVYGGTLSLVTVPKVGEFYNWQLTSDKAENFLRKIRRYLKIKNEQVRVALQWRASRSRHDRNYCETLRAMKRGEISKL